MHGNFIKHCEGNELEGVNYCLSRGFDVNSKYNGMTGPIFACESGNLVLQLLCLSGLQKQGTRTSRKERLVWSLCYETQHIYNYYFHWLQYEDLPGSLANPGTNYIGFHTALHTYYCVMSCPRKKVVDKK